MSTPYPTDRTRLELEGPPEVLGTLARSPGAGLFTLDEGARVVDWSPGAERITGLTRAQVRGRGCRLLDGPGCKAFGRLGEFLRDAGPEAPAEVSLECRQTRADGREVHLVGLLRRVLDGQGRTRGGVGLFLDVSSSVRPVGAAPDPAPRLVDLVGASAPMREVFRRLRLAADSDVTVLLTGESGTGKELAARAVHALSERAGGRFVAVNCAALPESLLESELFGHVAGAFTGAHVDRAGLVEEASGGTLFLDEIGDVSPLLQLKLLRVLQEHEVRRLGSDRTVPVDLRLICATHRDLAEQVREGRMREDFYYRIRVFDVRMPALRERPGDIPLLAEHLLAELAQRHRRPVPAIEVDAMEALVRHPWPGNVRELRNALEHALVVQRGENLSLLDLPRELRGAAPPGLGSPGWTPDQEAERLRILRALEDHAWNRTRTAESLGISRVTLWKKIRRYRLDEGLFRRGTREELGP